MYISNRRFFSQPAVLIKNRGHGLFPYERFDKSISIIFFYLICPGQWKEKKWYEYFSVETILQQ